MYRQRSIKKIVCISFGNIFLLSVTPMQQKGQLTNTMKGTEVEVRGGRFAIIKWKFEKDWNFL